MTAPETTLINVESSHYPPLLLRHPGNPILTRKHWPYSINSVFNAGATLLQDGTTLLLCRIEDRRGLSHLCAARSLNGVDGWQIDSEPTLMPSPKDYPEEIWGIEDPRITFVPELQQYAVTYTSYSRGGPGVSLALTQDFHSFERYGVIMTPDDKDSALLPRRINGYWALIHRPMTPLGAHMWISYSPDLRHWGRHRRYSKPAVAPGGMPTRSDSPRRRSKRQEAGSSSTTECGTPLRDVYTGWAWRFSIWRIRKNACCAATPGSSARKRTTNVMATSTMSSSPADTPWIRMATQSIFTTGPPTVRSHWPGPACALYWSGSMPMEVVNAGDRRMYEPSALALRVCLPVPSPSDEPRIYHQRENVPGLLQMRTGI